MSKSPGGGGGVSGAPSSSSLTVSQENKWLLTTFELARTGPTAVTTEDFYAVAKTQYRLKRYHLAVRCLEIYIARLSRSQAAAAATNSVARVAGRAASLPVGPLHLLGYAHYGAGSLSHARECFLACVRLGFESDWQLLVQIDVELSEAAQRDAEREAADGQQAVATLRRHIQATQMQREQVPKRNVADDITSPPPPTNETGDRPNDESEANETSDASTLPPPISSPLHFEPIDPVSPLPLAAAAASELLLTAMVTPDVTTTESL